MQDDRPSRTTEDLLEARKILSESKLEITVAKAVEVAIGERLNMYSIDDVLRHILDKTWETYGAGIPK